MKDPSCAAKARDFITIYSLALESPVLDLPFSGPDRASFYFLDRDPEAVPGDMAAAEQVFSGIFGVPFGAADVWSSNGTRRHCTAELKSGLFLILVAKAEHMADEDADAEERELEAVAA